MSDFLKLSPQTLSMIFSMLKFDDDHLVYIVDPTYQHQYYLSPSYEKIWRRPINEIYQDTTLWYNTVVSEDLELVVADMNKQQALGQIPLNNSNYRIFQPGGKLKWLSCKSFPIYNDNDTCVAIVGYIESVTQDAYTSLVESKLLKPHAQIFEITSIIEKELSVKTQVTKQDDVPYNGRCIRSTVDLIDKKTSQVFTLSIREIQCLHCLVQGMTANDTAQMLCLSRRRIESHLENCKHKLNCKNKYQLISYYRLLEALD